MNQRGQDTIATVVALLSLALTGSLVLDTWRSGAMVDVEHDWQPPPRFRLDIRQANVEELCLLPQIGPELARRIVSARAAGVPLESAEDLLSVRGIGPKKLAAIRTWVYSSGGPGTLVDVGAKAEN